MVFVNSKPFHPNIVNNLIIMENVKDVHLDYIYSQILKNVLISKFQDVYQKILKVNVLIVPHNSYFIMEFVFLKFQHV